MRKKISHTVTYILIILFIYAAVIKGINIPLFQSQLLQSPLIPLPWTNEISYLVPLAEIVIVVLLLFQSTNFWGLLFSYSLMLFYTIYLLTLVIFFSSNIPCACGGILGNLGYPLHISFNIVITFLSLLSLFFYKKPEIKKI